MRCARCLLTKHRMALAMIPVIFYFIFWLFVCVCFWRFFLQLFTSRKNVLELKYVWLASIFSPLFFSKRFQQYIQICFSMFTVIDRCIFLCTATMISVAFGFKVNFPLLSTLHKCSTPPEKNIHRKRCQFSTFNSFFWRSKNCMFAHLYNEKRNKYYKKTHQLQQIVCFKKMVLCKCRPPLYFLA